MIGLLLLAAVQTATSATPATTAPAAVGAPKVRCRRSEETGSHVKKKRVCHTEAEWRALDGRENWDLDRMRDRTPVNSQRPVG